MKIKTKLQLIFLVVMTLLAMVSWIVWFATQRVERTIEKGKSADDIERAVFALSVFTSDYVTYHEKQVRTHWWSYYRGVGILLDENIFDSPDDKGVLMRIRGDYQNMGDIFIKLTDHFEKDLALAEKSGSMDLYKDQESLLASSLTIKLKAVVDNANELADSSLQERNSARSIADESIFIGLGLLAGVILAFLLILYRSIADPLTRLHKGIERIGKGDLDFRVGTTASDEIGQLSRSFDIMVEQIKARTYELMQADVKDKALLESIGDGVLAVNGKGDVVLVNKAAEQLLGLSAKQMVGKSVISIIDLENEQSMIPEQKRPISLALLGVSPVSGIYYIKTKKKRFPGSFTATSVILNGRIEGAVVVFRDITREKELEKLHTDFLQLSAHQLRTPLSGIKWMIETMQKKILGPLTEKQKEYLGDIYKMNERMVKLVLDILHTLSLEGSLGTAKNKSVVLSDFYNDMVKSPEYVAKEKEVKLRVEFEADKKLHIEIDPDMLKNIFESLISNAINYSASGHEVVVGVREEPNAILCFVKDGGIGIPESEKDHIFERFYRASNAKKYKPDGTGLGLYITKMLAGKIAAEVFFDSQEGGGSIFYLRIPKKVIANKS